MVQSLKTGNRHLWCGKSPHRHGLLSELSGILLLEVQKRASRLAPNYAIGSRSHRKPTWVVSTAEVLGLCTSDSPQVSAFTSQPCVLDSYCRLAPPMRSQDGHLLGLNLRLSFMFGRHRENLLFRVQTEIFAWIGQAWVMCPLMSHIVAKG